MDGLEDFPMKAVLRKHKNVSEASTERLNAKTAFRRERAVFMSLYSHFAHSVSPQSSPRGQRVNRMRMRTTIRAPPLFFQDQNDSIITRMATGRQCKAISEL